MPCHNLHFSTCFYQSSSLPSGLFMACCLAFSAAASPPASPAPPLPFGVAPPELPPPLVEYPLSLGVSPPAGAIFLAGLLLGGAGGAGFPAGLIGGGGGGAACLTSSRYAAGVQPLVPSDFFASHQPLFSFCVTEMISPLARLSSPLVWPAKSYRALNCGSLGGAAAAGGGGGGGGARLEADPFRAWPLERAATGCGTAAG